MVKLLVEGSIWWTVVTLVTLMRYISRWLTRGSPKKFQADDWLMIVAFGFYTALTVTIILVDYADSNLLPPGFDYNTLDKEEIHRRQFGSKLILAVEQSQCVTIWAAKGCLIILYMRLTTLRTENIAIKVLAAYVVLTFIVMDCLYFGYWCRPFSNRWAVPSPNKQCNAATNHLIMNAVFNISSDCAMLAIGLPMFLRMNLRLQKKIPLVGIFGLGVFSILAAILNKVYSFSEPFGSAWTYWYTRESSTSMLVANLPFLWTFVKLVKDGRLKYSSQTAVEETHTAVLSDPGTRRHRPGELQAHGLDDVAMGSNLDKEDSKEQRGMSFGEFLRNDAQARDNKTAWSATPPLEQVSDDDFGGANNAWMPTPPLNAATRDDSGESNAWKPTPPLEQVGWEDFGARAAEETAKKNGRGQRRITPQLNPNSIGVLPDTPSSSTFPSLASRRSNGSFV